MPPVPDPAILDALDGLLRALELEPVGDDRFRLTNEPSRFPNLFGGQLVAQGLHAMTATVDGLQPSSIHAYFVTSGLPGHPVEIAVDRVRDGRTMATRRATVVQGGRCLLTAIGSFHTNGPGPSVGAPPPPVPPPDDLRSLQDWARDASDRLGDGARRWIERPPPLELRIGESPTFLTGAHATSPRSHWFRLPRPVGDDARLHAVLLTYASDYFLLDMAVRCCPESVRWDQLAGTSLDHAVWLHRPVRFDRWHLATHDTLAVAGQRGLVRGTIHDEDGTLVATVAQEVLLRPRPAP
jgi:acyl-CoA thioesterase-2